MVGNDYALGQFPVGEWNLDLPGRLRWRLVRVRIVGSQHPSLVWGPTPRPRASSAGDFDQSDGDPTPVAEPLRAPRCASAEGSARAEGS